MGSYLRPYQRDFSHYANLVASGRPVGSGIVLDGRALQSSSALRDVMRSKSLQVVLDSMGVEIHAPAAYARPSIRDLPWYPKKRVGALHMQENQKAICAALANAAVESGCTAVLAPTRFIQDLERDEINTDIDITIRLREALDSAGGKGIRIFYPLVTNIRTIGSETARHGIISALKRAIDASALDAIWIRAVGFEMGNSGPINLRRYVTGVRGLHELKVPITGDRAGTLGLAMLALGVTSSITSGITVGERYDPRPLYRAVKGKGFLPAPRVYLPAIGYFMDKERASTLLKHVSLKNWISCQRSCCGTRGLADTISDPRRHFVVTRSEEVADLAHVPEPLRAGQYMEKWLRPASDRATSAMRIDPQLEAHRNRIDAWRATLGAVLLEDAAQEMQPTRSASRLPKRMGA